MQNIAQVEGAFNASNENGTPENPLFSLTTGERMGIPMHTVTTRDRDFAFSLLEQAMEYDNEPTFGAARGVFRVEFFADANECASVLAVARGGNA